ncbi:hypothetical protein B0H16DRAFT_1454464 [Mycena metata]|uniref:Uncharacterized protein n=1 Tax=Mycena metata TaxID=1033252 RepID=A0AAD7JJM5_9AGAR|nr:hypothetical protein B0H16DRAFT_1454464 [Mycena metata]
MGKRPKRTSNYMVSTILDSVSIPPGVEKQWQCVYARRVLCLPQPGGAPCLRCVEKDTSLFADLCITTAVQRARPRKNPASTTTSRPPQSIPLRPLVLHPGPSFGPEIDCPELSPEFVALCFEDIRAVSFQIDLLPPQSRVLALCSVAYACLSSFHPSILGDGPRPESFFDPVFFSSSPELLACGVRRAPAIRAMRTKALKAAWDLNIILEPSNENTASCYLLDLMEQSDFGSAGRPWSTAYISHVRTLAPNWRASSPASAAAEWAGFLDQLLPCGPEPPALGDLLASLEKATPDPGFMLLFTSSRPYLMHVTSLARERHNNRSQPLSEAVVRKFMSALYELHSVLSLLLDRVDMAITPPGTDKPLVLDDSTVDALARAVAYGRSFGFSGIVLPFYRELQHRETSDASAQSERTRERQQHLRTQAHDLAVLGARELARGLRYLPKIHYAPVHWPTIRMFAEFCVEEAESGKQLSPEALGDLQTFADEMKLTGYSLDVASTPQAFALLQRLEGLINHAIVSLFIPTDGEWMEGAALDEEMGLN